MKIDILTFHRAYNYGAVLQGCALTKKLNELGAECEILDYWPGYFKLTYYYSKRITLSHIPVKTILRRFKNRDAIKVLKRRNKRFERFIDKNIPLSDKIYYDIGDISNNPPDCDAYLTGSDQVWHYQWTDFDPAFFLDFDAAKNKKKYSYAASFGMDKLPDDMVSEYKRRLTNYDAYSVREQSGAKILKELENVDANVNCDPTFLLKGEEWSKFCAENPECEPYILLYYTVQSKTLQEYAKKLSEEKKCRVICVPCNMTADVLTGKFDAPFGFEVRADCGPVEFLTLIKNAAYVLTNAFHGTVFSIIFHKAFLTQMKSDENKPNIRVEELFKTLGVKNHDLEADFDKIDNDPDWDLIEKNIEKIRNCGIDYLSEIIK